MKSWKMKILLPVILLSALVLGKYILFDFPISTGKRVGNLVKISKKGKLIKTWEGTIDEGSGDKLTTYFSVENDKIAQELYDYEGKGVVIYYEEYLVGWPQDTNYNVTAWNPKEGSQIEVSGDSSGAAHKLLSKTLFCSLLGSLFSNQELYMSVKNHLKENNLFLYNQIDKCNE
jgi:hypothetical protein